MKIILRIALGFALLISALSAWLGWQAAPALLHLPRREFTAENRAAAAAFFSRRGAVLEDFTVRAPDGAALRGWKVRAESSTGDWVLLFHGQGDNRAGMISHAALLLAAGYNVVMMDSRAHGASGGDISTYGWKEREDSRAVVSALEAAEHVRHLFALGESMGASIALQSAGADPRIEAVVAEAPFRDLREAAYDYAGLHWSPLLGKTLFFPGAWAVIRRGERDAGFSAEETSPEKSVAARAFPVLLICDEDDVVLPCRHSESLYAAARGPKILWEVPGATHTAALGVAPKEFQRRVLGFFASTVPAPHAQALPAPDPVTKTDAANSTARGKITIVTVDR
ncbi:MAG: alpha/beta fold hydrolase [Acidobacteriia bacterium]|nr:alpha/beta fold hydrolase [Terriglobia bacterium]